LSRAELEPLRRLAEMVAHDVNNALTAILGHTEILIADLEDGSPLRADLEEILGAAQRITDLTGPLLAFSGRQVLAPEVLDLGDLLRDLEPSLRETAGGKVALAVAAGPGVAVLADPNALRRTVLALAANARDAMPNGGRLECRVESVGGSAVLTVKDTGHGMSPEVLEHVFEPFFTTRGRRSGAGLSLAAAWGFIRQSGGTIEVKSEPGAGTMFAIRLPLAALTPEASPG
jgi:signal transduction histidine kinase